jgi:hypothetical protein
VIRSESLAPVLPLALGSEPAAMEYRELYRKGLALMEMPAPRS